LLRRLRRWSINQIEIDRRLRVLDPSSIAPDATRSESGAVLVEFAILFQIMILLVASTAKFNLLASTNAKPTSMPPM
jgi:Flp pilus assembly protein TadG